MMPPAPLSGRVEPDSPTELPVFARSVGMPGRRSLVLRGEIERLRLQLTRYVLEAATSLVLFAGMFLVFAYLGTVMEGRLSPFDSDPRILAVLYLVWMIVSTITGGSTSQLGADAATGVLESLFLTATPVEQILEMRALAHALHGAAMSGVLLLAFCLGTHWLPSPVMLATLVACVAGCTLTGVGLALALSGAALLSKRVGALMIPINFACMLAVMGGPARAAGGHLEWTSGLPFVAAAGALREALRDNVFHFTSIAIAVFGALPWVLIGRGVLARCIVACRRRGSTHTY
jgi:ABC-type thiamin/hydroxymethylpyrimidine transport system permease subunit